MEILGKFEILEKFGKMGILRKMEMLVKLGKFEMLEVKKLVKYK